MARILLFSRDFIAPAMAGPGIRYWEFAKQLSQKHEVVILCPGESTLRHKNIQIFKNNRKRLIQEIKNADVIITQLINLTIAFFAKLFNVKIIIDAYDPIFIEYFEIFKNKSHALQIYQNKHILKHFLFSFQHADFVLCANDKQRDLWLGFMLSSGCISPLDYLQNPNLLNWIDLVPFGLSSEPPKKKGVGVRELFGLKESDKVLIWGGGIWNWFDPISLLKAMKILQANRPDIHLCFMGVKCPNEHVPEMEMAVKSLEFAEREGMINRTVHFNSNWIPYEERTGYLLEADIGLSTHFSNVETHFSFRTRILDYIWAALPIICTEGDSFADLVQSHELGRVVPYEDPQAIADAIVSILENSEEVRANLQKVQAQFYWENVMLPIERKIEEWKFKKKSFSLPRVGKILQFFSFKVRFKMLSKLK